jgi:hypothetical protein
MTWFYFPSGVWCNVFPHDGETCITSTGQAMEMRSKAYDFYLHIREGHIIPMQDAKKLGVMKTADLGQHPTDLHIFGKYTLVEGEPQYVSEGVYFNDDGLNRTLTNNSNTYHINTYTNTGDAGNYFIVSIT